MIVTKMKKGFTLLELVVVVVVIGILASIAIPSYQAVIVRANEASAKTTVQALVTSAKIMSAFDLDNGDSILTLNLLNEAGRDDATPLVAADDVVFTATTPSGYTTEVNGIDVTVTQAGVVEVVKVRN